MKNLAVVISKSPTGDVYIITGNEVEEFVSYGFIFGGYAATEEEAIALGESFCK